MTGFLIRSSPIEHAYMILHHKQIGLVKRQELTIVGYPSGGTATVLHDTHGDFFSFHALTVNLMLHFGEDTRTEVRILRFVLQLHAPEVIAARTVQPVVFKANHKRNVDSGVVLRAVCIRLKYRLTRRLFRTELQSIADTRTYITFVLQRLLRDVETCCSGGIVGLGGPARYTVKVI